MPLPKHRQQGSRPQTARRAAARASARAPLPPPPPAALWSAPLLAAAACAAAGLLALPPAAAARPVVQAPAAGVRVIDGDTLVVGDTRVRLFGIDAPEAKQLCRRAPALVADAAGEFSEAPPAAEEEQETYECGAASTAALRGLVRGAALLCDVRGRDPYGRAVAVCSASRPGARPEEVNAAMVREGHALAYRRYSKIYVGAESEARAARRGLWAGGGDGFEQPEAWRAARRGPRRAAPAAGEAAGVGKAPPARGGGALTQL